MVTWQIASLLLFWQKKKYVITKSHPSVHISAAEPEETKQIRWRISFPSSDFYNFEASFFALEPFFRILEAAKILTDN